MHVRHQQQWYKGVQVADQVAPTNTQTTGQNQARHCYILQLGGGQNLGQASMVQD